MKLVEKRGTVGERVSAANVMAVLTTNGVTANHVDAETRTRLRREVKAYVLGRRGLSGRKLAALTEERGRVGRWN